MDASHNSVLGLVELADADDLIELHGSASFNVMRDVFHDRLKDWVRSKDQWRLLKNNRVCVILKDIGGEGELELAAAKLGRIFNEPHYHLGRPMPLEVAAGFAKLSGQNKDMKLAMQQAGIALKHAKKSSQLFDVYSPQFDRTADNERKLVERLETALELGELQLYYQPKVHAGYRSLIGAEALVRWHTRDRKVIMPDQFGIGAVSTQVVGAGGGGDIPVNEASNGQTIVGEPIGRREFQMLDHMEEHEYDEGTSDPFMHLLIHQIIDNQLNNKDPIEAYQFYLSMQKHKADHHDILHLMGALFMPQLFSSLKGEPVNE